jgi:hypothetical protein
MAPLLATEPLGTEVTGTCACCGAATHSGGGWLLRGDEELACYAYRWSESHEVRFVLAVAGTTAGQMRPSFAVVSCTQIGQDLHYSAVGPADSPWEASETLGRPLLREEALDPAGMYPDLWELTDGVVQHEPRLAERILALHGA